MTQQPKSPCNARFMKKKTLFLQLWNQKPMPNAEWTRGLGEKKVVLLACHGNQLFGQTTRV